MDMFFSLDFRVEKSYYYDKHKFSWYLDIKNINYPFYASTEVYEVKYKVNRDGRVYKEVKPMESFQIPIPEAGVRFDF